MEVGKVCDVGDIKIGKTTVSELYNPLIGDSYREITGYHKNKVGYVGERAGCTLNCPCIKRSEERR
jgi:hypothetical protein